MNSKVKHPVLPNYLFFLLFLHYKNYQEVKWAAIQVVILLHIASGSQTDMHRNNNEVT